jgi:hypothetical protein
VKVPRLVANVKDMVMVRIMVARKAAEVRTGARDCASEQAWFQVERRTYDASGWEWRRREVTPSAWGCGVR